MFDIYNRTLIIAKVHILAFATLIFVISVIGIISHNFGNKTTIKKTKVESHISASPTPSPTFSPTPTTSSNQVVSSPTPTIVSQSQNSNTDYQYPGSTSVSQDGTTVVYQSQDNTDAITNWYEEKIKALHLGATSFVKTNTNGNVLNKLSAANGSEKVQVEISKSNSGQTVTISITF